MSLEGLIKETQSKMDKAIDAVEHEMNSIRSGRASTAMVDDLKVEAYGVTQPLKGMATISAPDAGTILIQPWDASQLAAIEKAIQVANLGINPSSDGKVIRLNVPPLTEETRKGLVKNVHEAAEHGRISVRNLRRTLNDEIKKSEKENNISEDDRERFLKESQEVTDKHIAKIDKMMEAKEAEIMTV